MKNDNEWKLFLHFFLLIYVYILICLDLCPLLPFLHFLPTLCSYLRLCIFKRRTGRCYHLLLVPIVTYLLVGKYFRCLCYTSCKEAKMQRPWSKSIRADKRLVLCAHKVSWSRGDTRGQQLIGGIVRERTRLVTHFQRQGQVVNPQMGWY